MEPIRAHITTYGCQMNQLDAEVVAERLRACGARVVDDPADGNVLLFLTCSVRAHAEQRVFSNIGALKARKRAEPGLVIGLLGCMAQQHGEAIRRRAPLVDLVCAPARLAELPDLIVRARAARGGPAVALDPPRADGGREAFQTLDAVLDASETARPLGGPSPGHAYVTVMRGCDNFCAYCVVPYVRGPERSRAPAAVLEEVRRLVGQGARQITLLGQAVNQYAAEEGGRRWDLAALIERVAETPGLARLHFITNHPRAMTARLAGVFRDVPGVCPYLHMPAQSGSDAVLERMNRGYTAAEYAQRVAMVRDAQPEVAVASDFIVGFPGETQGHFEATLDLVRRMRFSGGFVFKYSPRPGTPAARDHADDVPAAEKRRRNQALLDCLQQVAGRENQRLIGRRASVFVEGPSPRPGLDRRGADAAAEPPVPSGPGWCQWRGRTPGNRIVVFDGPAGLAGREVEVDIRRATPLTLFGVLAGEGPAAPR